MSEYPMHGYLYNADGIHGPPTVLANREELYSFLGIFGTVALQDGLEFLVVSGDDEACYVHIKGGAVLYASGVEPQAYAQALRNYAHMYHLLSPEEPSP